MKRAIGVAIGLAAAICNSGDAVAGPKPHGAHHLRHLALFVGATTSSHETAATVGADGEMLLPVLEEKVGVAVFGEAVLAELTELIGGAAMVVHPWGGLKVIVGSGLANTDGHTHLLVRGGLAYDLHLSGMSLSPTLDVDRTNGHTVAVYGLAAGFGF